VRIRPKLLEDAYSALTLWLYAVLGVGNGGDGTKTDRGGIRGKKGNRKGIEGNGRGRKGEERESWPLSPTFKPRTSQ